MENNFLKYVETLIYEVTTIHSKHCAKD